MQRKVLPIIAIVISVIVAVVAITLATISLDEPFFFMIFIGFPLLEAALSVLVVLLVGDDQDQNRLIWIALIITIIIASTLLYVGAAITLEVSSLELTQDCPVPIPHTLGEYLTLKFA